MSRFVDEDTLQDKLVSAVVKQMKDDIEMGDTTCIFDLLYEVPVRNLVAFLPELKQDPFKRFVE